MGCDEALNGCLGLGDDEVVGAGAILFEIEPRGVVD